jgi:Zn-finger nucleic acid-binding protein
MICPRDHTPLIPNQRDGIAAQSCLQCHGVWFSRAALESLAQRASQPAPAEPPVPSRASGFVLRRLACPVCAGSQLQTRMQGDIEVSRCRDCGGIWLAKTEVDKILAPRKPPPKPNSQPVESAPGDEACGLGDFLASSVD